MSSSVTSSLSALATSPSDASYVPPPLSSAHRNRTLDNITQPPQPHRHGSQAHAAIEQIRVLLAYSGGPKCSCVLRWLLNTGYEVYVMIADLGGVEEEFLAAARDRALRIGARKVFVEDLRQDFLNQFVYQSIRANALYEGRLPLGLALSRPCIARRQVEIARREQCPYVAHGALNLNSDHCRFELAYYALDPNIKIVAPTRDRRLLEIARTEDELHRYLSENNMYFVLGEKEREGVHTGAGTSAGEMEAAQNQNHMLQKLAAHGSFNIFTRTHTVNDDPSNPIGMAPRTVGLGDEGATEGGGMDSSVLGGHCLSTYDAGGSTHSSAAVVAATSLAPHNIKPEPSITGACGNRAQAPNSLLWTINPSLVSEAMDQPDYLCISFHAGRLRSVYWYGRNEEPKIHIALEALGLIPSKKSSTASGITMGIGGDTGLCVTVSAGRRGTSAPRSELSGGTVAGFYTEQELTGGSNPHNHKGSTIPTSTSALDPTAPINMSISPTSMLGGELNASSSISDAATNIGQNINAHPSFHPTFLHHPHPSASDNVTSIYHPLSHFVSGSTNCEDVLASLGYRTYTTNTHPSIRMFELLNYIGARQGVGRIDMVANAQIGVKSRYFVECPGGTILFRAHEDLEGYVLDREVRRLRDMITPKFSELVYNGFWYSPEMEFVSAAVGNSQEVVEGAVLVRVYRGSVLPLDRFSPRTVCGHGGLASDIIATKHLHCVSPQSEQKMTHPSFTQVHHCPEDVAGYVRCASSRLKTASLEKKAFA